jgi:hypothetical protein
MKFVFQEDPKFYLAGDILQVRDDIYQIETGVKMEPLDGAKFVYLSDYIILELNHPTYSDVVMGTLFSKMWDMAKETLNLAQSASYNKGHLEVFDKYGFRYICNSTSVFS